MPFERFGMGAELFSSLHKEEDIIDKDWRPFAEECDRLQGIQIITTIDDAWGGFAASYAEALRDEFPKSCIWTWGLQSPFLGIPREKRQLRTINLAQSLTQLYATSSMLVPISVPRGTLPNGIQLDQSSPWHVGALLSTGIETSLLPTRLALTSDSSPVLLDDLKNQLDGTGDQRLSGLSLEVDVAESGSRQKIDISQLNNDGTYQKKSDPHIFGEVAVARGDGIKNGDQSENDKTLSQPASRRPICTRYVDPGDFVET